MADYSPHLTQLTTASWAAGSLATPTASAAYYMRDPDFNVEQCNMLPGDIMAGLAQPLPERRGARSAAIKFNSELRGLAGAPAAATPANVLYEGALLRACGMTETIVDATSLTYSLDNSIHLTSAGSLDPIDIALNIDQYAESGLNMVGDVTYSFKAGQLPLLMFDFQGNLNTAVATTAAISSAAIVAVPSPVPGPQAQAWFGASMTLNSVGSLFIESFSFKVGNRIFLPPTCNDATGFGQALITSRKPEGSCIVRVPLIATANFETYAAAQTAVPISFVYASGGATWKTHTITCTMYINKHPVKQNNNGELYFNLSFAQGGTSGLFTHAIT